jgi:hypothetical protein
MPAKIGGNRQQQRPRPCDNNALPLNGQAAFDHRLQSACTHHIGQRPTRERQKSFSSACRNNEVLVFEFMRDIGRLRPQNAAFRLIDNPYRTKQRHSGCITPLNPVGRFERRPFPNSIAPNLSAGFEIFIYQSRPSAALRRTRGRCDSRRPSTYHEHIEFGSRAASHLSELPCQIRKQSDNCGSAASH